MLTKRKHKWLVLTLLVITIGVLIILAGCSSDNGDSEGMNLNGAGATFPQPLYTKWFDEYSKIFGVKVNYQGIGSGAGINQITTGTVDFGATDGIMTDAQVSAAEKEKGTISHIPMASGAVAVIFNLPGIPPGELRLTGEVLADIYLKNILKWNDTRIISLNPGVTFPDTNIAVVHRSDGSGTSFIFTNYLCKVSQEWEDRVGNATSVKWPGDIGGLGNAGVAGQVQQLPNSIGYVELAYATQNQLSFAQIKNRAGKFLPPTLEGATRAAEGIELPSDMKIMITDSSNPDAYPIAGYTWILAYVNQKDKIKGEALAKMLWWAIHKGQSFCISLDYAPLSGNAVTLAENQILSMNHDGQPLITR